MLDKRQLMKFVQLMSSYDDDAKEAYNAAALEKLSEEAQELHGRCSASDIFSSSV